MEKKKLSKLVLKKETISNLSKSQQALILGGGSYQMGCKSYFNDNCETGELYTPDPCNCGSETCVCPEGLHSA